MKLKKFNDIFPSNSLLESFKGYPYKTIIVEVKSTEELKDLQIKLGGIYKLVNDLSDSCISFPNYIFIEPNQFHLTKDADIVYLTDDVDKEYQKYKHIYSMKNIDQHIYKMGEWDRIESILKYGIAKPSYKPRERVLEGTDNFPYRFKTEKELIDQYGSKWEEDDDVFGETGWNPKMKILFGTDYPYMDDELNFDDDLPRGEQRFIDKKGLDWQICWKMLTKNKSNKPNYSPRRKVLEEIENYPYRFKTEEEFLQEYGEKWMRILGGVPGGNGWNWITDMNYLFGTILEQNIDDEYLEENEYVNIPRRHSPSNNWYITRPMLTKNTPIVPSYLPKSKRVLEGRTDFPYRFKTREEFRKEFGRNWMNVLCPTWNIDMDEFLGKIYPFMEDEMDKENYKPRNERFPDSHGEDWAISWEMLTKNEPKVPNYNPRKLYIRE